MFIVLLRRMGLAGRWMGWLVGSGWARLGWMDVSIVAMWFEADRLFA